MKEMRRLTLEVTEKAREKLDAFGKEGYVRVVMLGSG